ncbi:hypothetical protein GQ53DRAFT_133065 [Thozetella sp. PMI_491]|nr:hypothetical protein GQ53DRAFT_133065 [Thozetella sp. PMI_491]
MSANDTASTGAADAIPDFRSTPDYHGYVEIQVNSVLIALSTIFYAMRMYTRAFMTKNLGLDDAIATVAFAILIVQSGMDIQAVSYGSGAHVALVPLPLLTKFFESLVIQTLLYFWAVAMVRLSILAFLPRLGLDKMTRIAIWIIGGLILAQAVIAFAFRLTECPNVGDNFLPPFLPQLIETCKSRQADNDLMLGHGVAGIILDTALLVLPIYIIYTKMIWSRRTIQVILVMSVGIFVLVTGIVRVILIQTLDFQADVTYEMPNVGIWTNLEGHVGFWCGCFPAMQPIIRIMSYKLGFRSQLRSTNGQSGPTGGQYYGAKSTGGSAALASAARGNPSSKGYLRNGSGVDEFDHDSDSQRGIVDLKEAIEMGNLKHSKSERPNIYKTTEIAVSYEATAPKRGQNTQKRSSPQSWVDLEH